MMERVYVDRMRFKSFIFYYSMTVGEAEGNGGIEIY